MKSYEGIERLREEIGTSLDLTDEKSYFLLNFIFYEIDSQATKILRLIKDVDPSIFERVRIALENANKDVKEILGEKYKGTITLSTVYYINPIRIKDGKAVKYRDILEIYDAILTGKNLSKKHIINNLVDGVRIIKFKKRRLQYNSRKKIHRILSFRSKYVR